MHMRPRRWGAMQELRPRHVGGPVAALLIAGVAATWLAGWYRQPRIDERTRDRLRVAPGRAVEG